MMKVNSIQCNGKSMELPITPEQLREYYDPFRERYIQDIFPDLKPCEREFIKTGTTPEEWSYMFGGCVWGCKDCKYDVKHISLADARKRKV